MFADEQRKGSVKMDLIDKGSLVNGLMSIYRRTGDVEIRLLSKCIQKIPTVDAVVVVRCRACKYYQRVYGGVPLGEVGHCICHSFETVPDWYCADGERKTE